MLPKRLALERNLFAFLSFLPVPDKDCVKIEGFEPCGHCSRTMTREPSVSELPTFLRTRNVTRLRGILGGDSAKAPVLRKVARPQDLSLWNRMDIEGRFLLLQKGRYVAAGTAAHKIRDPSPAKGVWSPIHPREPWSSCTSLRKCIASTLTGHSGRQCSRAVASQPRRHVLPPDDIREVLALPSQLVSAVPDQNLSGSRIRVVLRTHGEAVRPHV